MIVQTISYGNDCPETTSYIEPFFEIAHNCELQKNDFSKRWTILLDHYSESLPMRMIFLDHSPTLATRGILVNGTPIIYRTIFVTKMTVRSGPFSKLENDYLTEILDHISDWKVTAQPGPFYKLENDFS
jgi:hypothetical protein